jgi:hypothetical protein
MCVLGEEKLLPHIQRQAHNTLGWAEVFRRLLTIFVTFILSSPLSGNSADLRILPISCSN